MKHLRNSGVPRLFDFLSKQLPGYCAGLGHFLRSCTHLHLAVRLVATADFSVADKMNSASARCALRVQKMAEKGTRQPSKHAFSSTAHQRKGISPLMIYLTSDRALMAVSYTGLQ